MNRHFLIFNFDLNISYSRIFIFLVCGKIITIEGKLSYWKWNDNDTGVGGKIK